MTTHNLMNDSTASGQLSWQEPEGLALLGIPISKEAQQIGLVFASEQRNVKKGKQVFLNTLSVIAVHECLQMFEFESYLESRDCWNKFKRLSLSSNDADLFIQDFGIIECFPILPKQESIEIEEHLLKTRVGCVGVKFHERFNYVEMLGFKHFDKAFKSQQDNTRTFDVRDFQPFEDIFYYLVPTPINVSEYRKGNMTDVQVKQAGYLLDDEFLKLVKDYESKLKLQTFMDDSRVRITKKIDFEIDNIIYEILMIITVSFEKKNLRRLQIELIELQDHQLPIISELTFYDTDQQTQTFNLSEKTYFNETFLKQAASQVFAIVLKVQDRVFKSCLKI